MEILLKSYGVPMEFLWNNRRATRQQCASSPPTERWRPGGIPTPTLQDDRKFPSNETLPGLSI